MSVCRCWYEELMQWVIPLTPIMVIVLLNVASDCPFPFLSLIYLWVSPYIVYIPCLMLFPCQILFVCYCRQLWLSSFDWQLSTAWTCSASSIALTISRVWRCEACPDIYLAAFSSLLEYSSSSLLNFLSLNMQNPSLLLYEIASSYDTLS